ncbi:hypothetical protein [Lysinibacillus sp. FSL W7-1291]|uniref:hypothetical protein n=1 Tax=Lysinibacillus sp. FSL W7-1291 TaxID=2954544 RepID=UPI00315A71F5
MKKDIQELLDDHNLFARQIANVRLSNLSFDVYEFRDNYVMQVDLIFAEKSQFDTIQEAFSAIFKKELFDGEEWEVNDDPDPSGEQWITALEMGWINEYYPPKYSYMELVNKDDFISRFKNELAYLNAQESIVKELLTRLNNVEIIQIKKGHTYDYIFGKSDSHYFLFEWGIYD